MPDLTSNASTYRRGGYTYTGYISTIPQTVVLSGVVTSVPTYPALAVAYTLTSGSESAVTQDMTVRFYSSGGTLKAVLRIASGATTTSTSLKVNEFAQGTYDVTIGDTFQVISEYRILDRLVSATAALNKDSRIVYSDQGANPYPVCNSGGPCPGYSTSRDFYGSTSFATDPDSGGTINHTWDYIDGSGTTNVANPTGVTFPVGFRWVKHTATDASNSKATIQYTPVWVHDDDEYPPLSVQMDSLSRQATSPARVTFKLPVEDQGSIENLPDGALIVYWERERYNGTEASYGSNLNGRSHVKFSGYLLRDTISIDPETSEVTFEATNTLGILELTPALPQLMIRDTTPVNWQEVKGLSTKKILWYLSYWGATLQTGWDFVWTDGLDIDYSRIAVDGNNSVADQLRDIANSLNVDLTCDALGRIQFIRHPDYLTAVQRSSRTTTYDFTTADIIRIEWTNEHRGSVKTCRGEGITSAGASIFSNAPGNAPSSIGTGSETLAKQIGTSQSDLNTRTGMHYARVNGLYAGRFVPKGLRLTVPDGYDVLEPGNREFVTITLPASTNTRGVSFASSERWTVESVDISYDVESGAKDITYTLDHETIGVDGTTYTPPQESQNGLPDYPPINTTMPDLGMDTVVVGLVGGTSTIAIFCSDNMLYITTNFENPSSSGGPTWISIDLTALGSWPGGDVVQFEVDAYSPKYLGTGTVVNGWVCTTTHVMRITDIFGTQALTGVVAFGATIHLRTMRFERSVQNWGIVTSYYPGAGVYASYTTDGLTWTEIVVDANYDTNASLGWIPGIWVDPHTAGHAITSAFDSTATGGGLTASLRETTDYGATWGALASPTTNPGRGLASCIVVPYANTTASTIYYAHTSEVIGSYDPRMYQNNSDVSPNYSAANYGPYPRARSISFADDDPTVGVVVGIDDYTGLTTNSGVFITRDAAATWTPILTPSTTRIYTDAYVGSANAIYLIGVNGAVGFSDGTTVDSRIGNISTSGQTVGLCGG